MESSKLKSNNLKNIKNNVKNDVRKDLKEKKKLNIKIPTLNVRLYKDNEELKTPEIKHREVEIEL
tara:strand:- start:265 stop:459 length:195 start_codon:yes stop_codon:yes gene_type:complete